MPWLVVYRFEMADGRWDEVYKEFSDEETANAWAKVMYEGSSRNVSVSVYERKSFMC